MFAASPWKTKRRRMGSIQFDLSPPEIAAAPVPLSQGPSKFSLFLFCLLVTVDRLSNGPWATPCLLRGVS